MVRALHSHCRGLRPSPCRSRLRPAKAGSSTDVPTTALFMTILFFPRLFYPHIGGVEKHVMEISRRLVDQGHEITVIAEKTNGGKNGKDFHYNDTYYYSNKVRDRKIKIIRINAGREDWFKKFRVWKNLWRYKELIKRSDIVHAHDVFFWYLPFRFLYPSKKVFTTFHGYEGNKIPGLRSKLMHKVAEVLSNGNICVGDFLKKWYGTKTDYITYGAVETPNHKLQITNKYKRKNTRLAEALAKRAKYKILFLGRLEEETGIMNYLLSLKILKEKGHKFNLTVMGDGSLRKKAQDFCLENKINAHFMGFVGNTEGYLQNCDFVFVSRYLGILEALAYKKLVFAVYNNPIKEDYLKMAPFADFISISKDYRELSDRIEYYLKNEQKRSKMIDQGFSWVKNETWGKMTNLYINLWKKE